MNELSLFTGIGGGLLGTRLLGWTPICAVEKVPYRREVLLRRQRDGVLPLFPIWDDVRTFDGRQWRGKVDIVTAGFPCQPFSIAGKRRGPDDERNMWPDTIRILRGIRPQFCLLENVPGLIRHDYFGKILGDLAEAGYDAEWDIISARDVGAPHLRKRLWIVAHTNEKESARLCSRTQEADASPRVCGCDVPDTQRIISESGTGGRGVREGDSESADAEIFGRETRGAESEAQRRESCIGINCSGGNNWWATEPDVGRVVDGCASRVDRLAAIGDAQLPAVVRAAWMLLDPERVFQWNSMTTPPELRQNVYT